MQIFGEKINTINKNVASALLNKDCEFFRNLAISQIESGIVDVIDINVGSDPEIESEYMKWVVEIVEDVCNGKVSISIDSSSPKTIITGIEQLKGKRNNFINSITLEKSRNEDLLPLAKEYGLNVIALPIEGGGIPDTSDKRLALSFKLAELIEKCGIPIDKLYIDCLIEPVSISSNNALISLETLRKIKKNLPQVKTFICLSAVSFGLPSRKLLNRNFLTLLIKEGIDAIILDPLDIDIVSNIHASNLLINKDEYCLKYLNYIKKSKADESQTSK